MELFFLRHGKAEDLSESAASDDFGRALTNKGIDETKALAEALERLEIVPDQILTSPLVRAKQTAEIVAKRLELKKELSETELLAPGCDLKQLRELIGGYRTCKSLMVVGHEPDFSSMIGQLIGGAGIEMKKGALAAVSIESSLRPGAGVLEWLVTPKFFRDDADE